MDVNCNIQRSGVLSSALIAVKQTKRMTANTLRLKASNHRSVHRLQAEAELQNQSILVDVKTKSLAFY